MAQTILILTNRIPYPLRDGGALAMDAMIRGYQQAGWQVYVLAMNTSRHYVEASEWGRLYIDLAGFQTVDVDNEVSAWGVLRNFFFSSEPEHANRFRSGAFGDKLKAMLAQVKPDVVQLESPFLASYIPIIRKESQARLVYRSHNIEADIWSRLARESKGLKRFYLKNLSRRIAAYEEKLWKDVDLILPITSADANTIRERGIKTSLVVAPFGMETATQDVDLPRGAFKVYHIGAMDWLPNKEGVEWFLKEAWPLAHEWAPEVTFYFAGRAMPESMAENLPEGAFCLGEVGDARAFISDKHILVVPLRSGSGIRVKTLEAMAAGKLVISTDIGMQGIDAQPDLHYLRANSAQEFAHLIAWADGHPEKAAAIVNSAQQLIREHFDAASIMKNVVDALGGA
jgi:glycosyltransferase involved in cell wall biosynthesis